MNKNLDLRRILSAKKGDIERAPLTSPEAPLRIIGSIEKDIKTDLRRVVTTLGVIKNPKKEVLILRRAERKGSRNHGLWTLPGGRLNSGCRPEDEVIREIKEETNLDAIVESEFGTFYEVVPECGYIRMIHAFGARVDSFSDIKLSPEHDEWKFYFPHSQKLQFDGVCQKVIQKSEARKHK